LCGNYLTNLGGDVDSRQRRCIELGRSDQGKGAMGRVNPHSSPTGRVLRGEQVYSVVVVRVMYVHVGIPIYLGNTKESEVADTEGSTATMEEELSSQKVIPQAHWVCCTGNDVQVDLVLYQPLILACLFINSLLKFLPMSRLPRDFLFLPVADSSFTLTTLDNLPFTLGLSPVDAVAVSG
jgi:hypothetical protein